MGEDDWLRNKPKCRTGNCTKYALQKEVSWTEFESLAENVAQNCSLQPELVQMALLIMRLFYLHQNREQDYSISLNEFRAQVLTHELAHLELYRTMGDKWFSEHVGSGEMFAMLVELTYGLRQYDRLRSIFEQYLGSACGAQEDRLNSGCPSCLQSTCSSTRGQASKTSSQDRPNKI